MELGPARQRTVLAALLVDANRPVPVDQLADRVWADGPPHRATQTLYGYVSRLRRLLPGVIARGPGGYVCTVDEEMVDVYRFHRLLGAVRQADDDARAVALFQKALALWRGEPFAGADTLWFNTVRDTRQKERWAAELDCADLRLRLGEHTALLALLAGHSTAHPLDERLAAQYMLALYRCGRQADALAHYRHLRGILRHRPRAGPSAPSPSNPRRGHGAEPHRAPGSPTGSRTCAHGCADHRLARRGHRRRTRRPDAVPPAPRRPGFRRPGRRARRAGRPAVRRLTRGHRNPGRHRRGRQDGAGGAVGAPDA
ncbi:AfsR/SARP family transcriptional regulator [Streptomyces sp. S4.7]|uniref:AfsR/SARP family transcriptional regulator n=1 Tax=Streptomyces sp. S4.7 TaxID=2705439 RepID=UPI0023B2D53A|nr:AfsR/SARP family transcriptional regulator [Streptomyces sp. S4.7]